MMVGVSPVPSTQVPGTGESLANIDGHGTPMQGMPTAQVAVPKYRMKRS